jgi:hypothetical protein
MLHCSEIGTKESDKNIENPVENSHLLQNLVWIQNYLNLLVRAINQNSIPTCTSQTTESILVIHILLKIFENQQLI